MHKFRRAPASDKPTKPPEKPELGDLFAASKLTGLSTKTLGKLFNDGELPACKLGRKWVCHLPTLVEHVRQKSLENLRPANANPASTPQVTAEGGPATNAAADREVSP